jgi:hypothetical protein
MATQFHTREAWLQAALTRVTVGWPTSAELPENVRISVGFPQQSPRARVARVAEHYRPAQSAGGQWEIFISPTLSAAADVCRAVALEAARIATARDPSDAETVALNNRADNVAAKLPPYPHDALQGATARPPAGSVGSRYIKVACGGCGYNMRVTRHWLYIAIPNCPSGHGAMRVHGQPLQGADNATA